MEKYFLLLFIFLAKFSFAQTNLIANGSFEQYTNCINSNGELDSCIDWHAIMNTPDYYNSCTSLFDATVPHNQCGYQVPFEGNAYIGLATYIAWDYYREFAGSQLIDTMIPGNHYHISMRVSSGFDTVMKNVTACSNKLGVRFTTYPYSNTNQPPINNYAQLYEDTIIESHDSINWVLLAWDYIPDSAYTYVSIGNFFTDTMTSIIVDSGQQAQFAQAYYYIDSVNIICTDISCSNGISIIEKDKATLRFDSNSNSIYLLSNYYMNGKLSIINTIGQTIEELKISNGEQVNLSNFKQGFYIALFQSEKTTLTKKIIIQK